MFRLCFIGTLEGTFHGKVHDSVRIHVGGIGTAVPGRPQSAHSERQARARNRGHGRRADGPEGPVHRHPRDEGQARGSVGSGQPRERQEARLQADRAGGSQSPDRRVRHPRGHFLEGAQDPPETLAQGLRLRPRAAERLEDREHACREVA